MKKANNNAKKFNYTPIDEKHYNKTADYDLHQIYECANDELAMQQTKRDQLIVIYLAMFSFLLPFALSQESISWALKGLIFIATGVIGIMFCLISVRYKIYKEIYWMSCQSISVMKNIKKEEINKEIIQSIFYDVLRKKGKKFMVAVKGGEADVKKFSKWKYLKKNIFSAETLYFLVLNFITATISGLGIGLIVPFMFPLNLITGISSGLVIFIVIFLIYNHKVASIYNVLNDGSDASFNSVFEKAWHLHIYIFNSN